MREKVGRIPKYYNGLEPTGRLIGDLLIPMLGQFEKGAEDNSKELIDSWPKLVGEKVAAMTKAVSYEKGVFLVKVQNSTLYSLLSDHEKPRLLKQMQDTFPHLKIKKILFRMG
jgi:hypothetical protein